MSSSPTVDFSQLQALAEEFNNGPSSNGPVTTALEPWVHRAGGAVEHVRRFHPISWLLWLSGPLVVAADAVAHLLSDAESPVSWRWVAVGVLLVGVQMLNRFGLSRYGVPRSLKAAFSGCTLAAALIAAQPMIVERVSAMVAALTG